MTRVREHAEHARAKARELWDAGVKARDIAAETGVPRGTVDRWASLHHWPARKRRGRERAPRGLVVVHRRCECGLVYLTVADLIDPCPRCGPRCAA